MLWLISCKSLDIVDAEICARGWDTAIEEWAESHDQRGDYTFANGAEYIITATHGETSISARIEVETCPVYCATRINDDQ